MQDQRHDAAGARCEGPGAAHRADHGVERQSHVGQADHPEAPGQVHRLHRNEGHSGRPGGDEHLGEPVAGATADEIRWLGLGRRLHRSLHAVEDHLGVAVDGDCRGTRPSGRCPSGAASAEGTTRRRRSLTAGRPAPDRDGPGPRPRGRRRRRCRTRRGPAPHDGRTRGPAAWRRPMALPLRLPPPRSSGTSSDVQPSSAPWRRPGDRLDLGVLVEAGHAVLPADAAVLVAAEGHVGAVGRAAVDAHEAGLDPTSHGQRMLQRARHHVAGQTVGAVVGDPDRVFLVVERDDAQHRAEDLLLGDGHLVVDVDEKRWPDVISLVETGRAHRARRPARGALVDALLDVARHPLELPAARSPARTAHPGSAGSPQVTFS
jgi:hypothetical protein